MSYSYATLTPAYGRDYRSAAAVKADWEANKDFILHDMFSRYDGKPINRSACAGVYSRVNIRYAKRMRVVELEVSK